MIVLQLMLFCALFTLMVKIGVGNNALNGLYFYPKPVQERVYELGLTDRETVAKKRKLFMTAFFAVMTVALILIIRVWNGIRSFGDRVCAGTHLPRSDELVRRDRDRQALGRTQPVLKDPRNRGDPLCSDLAAGFEETGDPDADLDCRGSSHCRNRYAPLT